MRKFLQPLLIGELAPEEPSQDGPQNVRRALVEAKPPVGGWRGWKALPVAASFELSQGALGPRLGLPSLPGQTVVGRAVGTPAPAFAGGPQASPFPALGSASPSMMRILMSCTLGVFPASQVPHTFYGWWRSLYRQPATQLTPQAGHSGPSVPFGHRPTGPDAGRSGCWRGGVPGTPGASFASSADRPCRRGRPS